MGGGADPPSVSAVAAKSAAMACSEPGYEWSIGDAASAAARRCFDAGWSVGYQRWASSAGKRAVCNVSDQSSAVVVADEKA